MREHLGKTRTDRIDTLVTAIVENSGEDIGMDAQTMQYFDELHTFLHQNLYHDSVAKIEEKKVDTLISQMFGYFLEHIEKLPSEYIAIAENEGREVAVCDYIASMTDNYALEIYHDLFIPRSWTVHHL